MKSIRRFDGKVALVTDAGRGMGRAVAMALAELGAVGLNRMGAQDPQVMSSNLTPTYSPGDFGDDFFGYQKKRIGNAL